MDYFDDYDWCEPEYRGQADEIVSNAIRQLEELVSDDAKIMLQEYHDLETRKLELEREIHKLESQKHKSEEDLKDQIALYERMDMEDLPRGFVNKIVDSLIGDFKIGDYVWTIGTEYRSFECPLCHGKGVVFAKIGENQDFEIKCPKCDGYKKISKLSYYAQKRKIERFEISLSFNSDNRMWVVDEDHIVFYDGNYNRNKNGLYKTEQEAIDAATKKNAEVGNKPH